MACGLFLDTKDGIPISKGGLRRVGWLGKLKYCMLTETTGVVGYALTRELYVQYFELVDNLPVWGDRVYIGNQKGNQEFAFNTNTENRFACMYLWKIRMVT
jgi:hypothetical protein